MQSGRDRYSAGRRGAILLIGVAVDALILAVYLYDRSRRDVIASGVRIGGVSVGGLDTSAARARVERSLGLTRSHWITLGYGGLRFSLNGGQAGVRAAVEDAVQEALAVSRSGWIVSRTVRGVFGERLNRDIPMRVSYSRSAIEGLLARVERGIDRSAQDASVAVHSNGMLAELPSHDGRAVEVQALATELDRALSEPAVTHLIPVTVRVVEPKVRVSMLAARYPAYIVVDRPEFKLFFYRHLRRLHTYAIAVGMQGLETPAGLHHILDKEVNPAWHVPQSSWAGALAGHVIPPGPEDPLVARWMAIDELGDGIHGTNEPESIGGAASHGCIRMLVSDVIALYGLTPLGTPVYVI
jgi:lipoprotein-anchoring transpeptidase ErfK/SrfK